MSSNNLLIVYLLFFFFFIKSDMNPIIIRNTRILGKEKKKQYIYLDIFFVVAYVN